jgi:hypothetical protein
VDSNRSISKEHRRGFSNIHGSVSKMKYRDFILSDDSDIIRGMFTRYFKEVNSKDISKVVKRVIRNQEVDILESDYRLYSLINEGFHIRLGILEGELMGFMLYHIAYDCILAIDGLYVKKESRQNGIGAGFIRSLEKPIKKLFFQSHVAKRPVDLFGALKALGANPKKVHRDGDLITWECSWIEE